MNVLRSIVLCALPAACAASAADRGSDLEPAATRSAAWKQALATMRMHHAPGLVFVVPPADKAADPAAVAMLSTDRRRELKTARDVFLAQLHLLRRDVWLPHFPTMGEPAADDPAYEPPDVSMAFLLAVPVVADAEVCGAQPGETIVVLGPDGKRRHGTAVDMGDRAAVQAAIAPHLFDLRELTARCANVPPRVRAMVAEFHAAGARVSLIFVDSYLSSVRSERARSRSEALWAEFFASHRTLLANRFAVAPALLHIADERIRMRKYVLTMYEPFGTEAGAAPEGPELQLLPP